MSEELIINREASDSIKGIRYQKIRLLKKMLQLIKKNENAYIIGFPEFWEDLYIMGEKKTEIMEQDKEYSSKFTINSNETKKALVSFIDIYLTYKCSKDLKFIFHTNTEYGKESKSKMLEMLGLEPLEKPILEYLINRDFSNEVIEFMSKVVIYSYEEIYNTRKSNLKTLKDMTIEQWREFFGCIYYEFGQPNLEEVNKTIYNDIVECIYFTPDLIDKEELIKCYLLETIDQRMSEENPLKKAITSKEIELIYLKVRGDSPDSKFDPNFEEWSSILLEKEEMNDVRNLKEKILDVCEFFPERSLKILNREATTAKSEIKILNTKQLNALKFRVYESMGNFFENECVFNENYTKEGLKEIIRSLKTYAINDIQDLKKDYDYGLKNEIIIEKIVVMLIDECFYSFEGDK